MNKLLQREFWLPVVTAVLLVLQNLLGLDLSETEVASIAGVVSAAVIAIAVRKLKKGE